MPQVFRGSDDRVAGLSPDEAAAAHAHAARCDLPPLPRRAPLFTAGSTAAGLSDEACADGEADGTTPRAPLGGAVQPGRNTAADAFAATPAPFGGAGRLAAQQQQGAQEPGSVTQPLPSQPFAPPSARASVRPPRPPRRPESDAAAAPGPGFASAGAVPYAHAAGPHGAAAQDAGRGGMGAVREDRGSVVLFGRHARPAPQRSSGLPPLPPLAVMPPPRAAHAALPSGLTAPAETPRAAGEATPAAPRTARSADVPVAPCAAAPHRPAAFGATAEAAYGSAGANAAALGGGGDGGEAGGAATAPAAAGGAAAAVKGNGIASVGDAQLTTEQEHQLLQEVITRGALLAGPQVLLQQAVRAEGLLQRQLHAQQHMTGSP